MITIFTKRPLAVSSEVVVYAPSAIPGEPVKFCLPDDRWALRPVAIGKCAGRVPKAEPTPKRHGITANPHRDYRTFIVTEVL